MIKYFLMLTFMISGSVGSKVVYVPTFAKTSNRHQSTKSNVNSPQNAYADGYVICGYGTSSSTGDGCLITQNNGLFKSPDKTLHTYREFLKMKKGDVKYLGISASDLQDKRIVYIYYSNSKE